MNLKYLKTSIALKLRPQLRAKWISRQNIFLEAVKSVIKDETKQTAMIGAMLVIAGDENYFPQNVDGAIIWLIENLNRIAELAAKALESGVIEQHDMRSSLMEKWQ